MLCVFYPIFHLPALSLSLFLHSTFVILMLLKLLKLHQHQTGVNEIRISFNAL